MRLAKSTPTRLPPPGAVRWFALANGKFLAAGAWERGFREAR